MESWFKNDTQKKGNVKMYGKSRSSASTPSSTLKASLFTQHILKENPFNESNSNIISNLDNSNRIGNVLRPHSENIPTNTNKNNSGINKLDKKSITKRKNDQVISLLHDQKKTKSTNTDPTNTEWQDIIDSSTSRFQISSSSSSSLSILKDNNDISPPRSVSFTSSHSSAFGATNSISRSGVLRNNKSKNDIIKGYIENGDKENILFLWNCFVQYNEGSQGRSAFQFMIDVDTNENLINWTEEDKSTLRNWLEQIGFTQELSGDKLFFKIATGKINFYERILSNCSKKFISPSIGLFTTELLVQASSVDASKNIFTDSSRIRINSIEMDSSPEIKVPLANRPQIVNDPKSDLPPFFPPTSLFNMKSINQGRKFPMRSSKILDLRCDTDDLSERESPSPSPLFLDHPPTPFQAIDDNLPPYSLRSSPRLHSGSPRNRPASSSPGTAGLILGMSTQMRFQSSDRNSPASNPRSRNPTPVILEDRDDIQESNTIEKSSGDSYNDNDVYNDNQEKKMEGFEDSDTSTILDVSNDVTYDPDESNRSISPLSSADMSVKRLDGIGHGFPNFNSNSTNSISSLTGSIDSSNDVNQYCLSPIPESVSNTRLSSNLRSSSGSYANSFEEYLPSFGIGNEKLFNRSLPSDGNLSNLNVSSNRTIGDDIPHSSFEDNDCSALFGHISSFNSLHNRPEKHNSRQLRRSVSMPNPKLIQSSHFNNGIGTPGGMEFGGGSMSQNDADKEFRTPVEKKFHKKSSGIGTNDWGVSVGASIGTIQRIEEKMPVSSGSYKYNKGIIPLMRSHSTGHLGIDGGDDIEYSTFISLPNSGSPLHFIGSTSDGGHPDSAIRSSVRFNCDDQLIPSHNDYVNGANDQEFESIMGIPALHMTDIKLIDRSLENIMENVNDETMPIDGYDCDKDDNAIASARRAYSKARLFKKRNSPINTFNESDIYINNDFGDVGFVSTRKFQRNKKNSDAKWRRMSVSGKNSKNGTDNKKRLSIESVSKDINKDRLSISPAVSSKVLSSSSRRRSTNKFTKSSSSMHDGDNDELSLLNERYIDNTIQPDITERNFKGIVIGATYQHCFEDNAPVVAPPSSCDKRVVGLSFSPNGSLEIILKLPKNNNHRHINLGRYWNCIRASPEGYLISNETLKEGEKAMLYYFPRHPRDWIEGPTDYFPSNNYDTQILDNLDIFDVSSDTSLNIGGSVYFRPPQSDNEDTSDFHFHRKENLNNSSSFDTTSHIHAHMSGHSPVGDLSQDEMTISNGDLKKQPLVLSPFYKNDEYDNNDLSLNISNSMDLSSSCIDNGLILTQCDDETELEQQIAESVLTAPVADWNRTCIVTYLLDFLLGDSVFIDTTSNKSRSNNSRRTKNISSNLEDLNSYRLVSKAWALGSYRLLARHLSNIDNCPNLDWHKYSNFIRKCGWGKFLSKGACKDVYAVTNAAKGGLIEAVSIMDVDDLYDRGIEDEITQELEITMLCSSLVSLNICPNLVQVFSCFRSDYSVPDRLWRNTSFSSASNGNNNVIMPKKNELIKGCYQYIRMEFCKGGDLEEVVRSQHQLTLSTVKSMFFQMAFALYTTREQLSLRHYDIKLLNFFVSTGSAVLNEDNRIQYENNIDSVVNLHIGFGAHKYILPLKSNELDLVKLADFGTSSIGSGNIGNQITVQQFTTLENTPPEFLILGSVARQSFAADTFCLGLSFFHLLTGYEPYEELLKEVVCPQYLIDLIQPYWQTDVIDSPHYIIKELIYSIDNGGDTNASDRILYDTLYRYIVLFGIPADINPSWNDNPIWHAIKTSLIDCKGNKKVKHKECLSTYQIDKQLWSIQSGNHRIIVSVRDRLQNLGEDAGKVLLSMVHLDPGRRLTMNEILQSSLFYSLRESNQTSSSLLGLGTDRTNSRNGRGNLSPIARIFDVEYMHYYKPNSTEYDHLSIL